MIRNWFGKTVWLVGASSGIGRALALQFAELGAQLILTARRESVLAELNDELGGHHTVIAFDIADDSATQQAVEAIQHRHGRIDVVICLAGAYEPSNIVDLDYETQRNVIDTNLHGTLNVIRHVLPRLRDQGKGLIAIYGSVAGYRGLPAGQPYSATKSALINFAESLYLEEKKHNIDVKIINSGFVDTPLTKKNTFTMPMIISAEMAAQSVITGLGKRAFEIHFPKSFTYLMKVLGRLPNWLYFRIGRGINS